MRLPLRLALAWLLYGLLGAFTVNGFGLVGEVAISWGLGRPPEVLLAWDEGQPIWADGPQHGPLHAAQVRPMERLELFGLALPLAVNEYTGGPADWPARLLFAATGSLKAVGVLHLALGALLIGLVHRFLRFHGSSESAPTAALLLATDWSFVFYRKALGGTEILLQAAGLLVLWAFWSRRWSGGRHGSIAFAVGAGLGLLAKATFVATLGALGLAIVLTRWDRARLRPPDPPRWGLMLALVLLITAPLWGTLLHHSLIWGDGPRILSHDRVALQAQRAVMGWESLMGQRKSPDRELAQTLGWFLFEPLAWTRAALGTTAPPVASFWRVLGLALALGGSALEWLRRSNSPSGALLRFMSVYAPLQLGALWLANRDMHHLAQATPSLVIWAALSLDRLASTQAGHRSVFRALLTLTLATPWIIGGVQTLRATDPALTTVRAPMLTEPGQEALVLMLQRCEAQPLWTSDYELYGMLDLRLPGWTIHHAWGDISRRFEQRPEALTDLLIGAKDSYYLVVRPSAPMIYNLSPTLTQLQEAAQGVGLRLTLCEELSDAQGAWASVYAVKADAP